MKRIDRILILIVAVLTAAWLVGQVLRDAARLTGILFCIPSPCTALALLLTAALLMMRKRRKAAVLAAALSLLPLGFIAGIENQWTRPSESNTAGADHRLVHWNIGWARRGWDGIREELDAQNPDIMILSEIPGRVDAEVVSSTRGSGYALMRFRNMAVAARGELEGREPLIDEDDLKAFRFRWRCGGEPLLIVVVDMPSSLWNARDPLLRRITDAVVACSPDIIVGDFNAPRRSRALCPLPEGFSHAYDDAGCGWSYTWPVPCPVLAIDQCITGSRVKALKYDLGMNRHSDHRMQILDFAIQDN